MDITIDGVEYVVVGDYPNGRYYMSPKNKGEQEKAKNKIKRMTKVDVSAIDWDTFVATDTGKVLTAILCGIFNTNFNKLKN